MQITLVNDSIAVETYIKSLSGRKKKKAVNLCWLLVTIKLSIFFVPVSSL